jgi:hypothetical protein
MGGNLINITDSYSQNETHENSGATNLILIFWVSPAEVAQHLHQTALKPKCRVLVYITALHGV